MKTQGWSRRALLLASLLLLAGCGGGGSNLAPAPPGGTTTGGTTTGGTTSGGTTTGGATSGGPQPASTYTGSVTVTYQGAPRAGVLVALSQGNTASVIGTAQTNAQGVATFPNLVSGVTYCYTATFSPAPGSNVNGSTCSNSTAPARLDLG